MKKKNLFLGVLLASAVFSLAACGNGNGTSTTSDTTPATSETTPDTTPTTSATTPDTTPTTSATTPTKDKFDVKYYAVIGDADAVEIADAKQTVEDGSTTTAPEAKLAKDGYKIAGYYTNEALGAKFDFTTPITKATKIYVAYEALSVFDTMAADTNKVLAYDFNEATTISYADISYNSTTPTLKGTDADHVKVENNAVSVNGVSSTQGDFIVDFGGAKTIGVLKVYYEVTLKGIKNKEAWFKLNGTSSTLENKEVFAIRTGASSNFAYRFDGGEDVNSSKSISANTVYKVLVELDTAEGKISVTVDDTKIADGVTCNIAQIRGLEFAAKNDGSANKVIDNLAVTFEAKTANPLITAKTAANDAIDAYVAGTEYAALDSAVKALVDAQVTKSKAAIAAATTTDAVATAKGDWDTFVAANKYVVTVTPYTAADTVATGLTEYKVATLGGTVDLSKISYSGYEVGKIYTNAALTNEFVATTEIAANTQLYVQVTEQAALSKYSFAASSLTAAADKEAIAGSITAGDNNFFTIVSNGKATKRTSSSGDVSSIELDKSFAAYIMITTTAPATVKLTVASTGSSNTTTGFGVYTDTAGTTLAAGTTAGSATGTAGTELTFTLTAAGTYYIGYTESARNGRILSVEVSY